MKTLIRKLSASCLVLMLTSNLFSQTIQIDLNFSGKDQIVMDLKTYPLGFYMISLNARNQVIDSKKLGKGGN